MKKLLVLSIAMLFAVSAFAVSETEGKARTPWQGDLGDRDMFYEQAPSSWWWTTNGSTPFEAEEADDIPDELVGMLFNQVGFYVGAWEDCGIAPPGGYVNIYLGECPPAMTPAQSYHVAWTDLGATIVYEDPGWLTIWQCTALLPDAWTVEADMSLGFQVDIFWGEAAPYCGVVLTEDYTYFGCGEAYWSGDYWGYPRWGTISGYFGTAADVAYSLGTTTTAAGESDWGAVKSLY